MRTGRPPLANVRRRKGRVIRSEAEREAAIKAVGWAQRIKHGIPPAERDNALAGYTLGQLRLLGQSAAKSGHPDFRSINEDQYWAGIGFARTVRAYQRLTGAPSPHARGQSLERSGPGVDHADFDEGDAARIRRNFVDAWNALAEASREFIPRWDGPPVRYGWRLMEVMYGVCVEEWPIRRLSDFDYGALRTGLNVLSRSQAWRRPLASPGTIRAARS